MSKRRLPERLMPLATRHGLRPFYGDVHNHCGLSYGHGSLETALKRAARQLDFVSVTGHAFWPDMPVDDPAIAHIVAFHVEGFARLARAWPGHFASLAAAAKTGLTVFPGYEIHSSAYGDYTILYKDLVPRDLIPAENPAALRMALERTYPGAAMAFPHHIGYRPGARGINWSVLDPALSPVIEMMSMHGAAETSLGDRPYLHSMGPSDGHQTMRHGLGLGHVFGVLGNTDHHSGYPGSHGHGRSVVYAAENASAAIWSALWARRTGALTGDNTHLFFTVGEGVLGDVVPPAAAADLRLEAVAGSFIDHIDVVRNGRVVHRITPEVEPAPIDAGADGSFETMLVLELGWGARGSSHRWRGTLDVQGGDILAVEPRLRGAEVVSPLEGAADGEDTDAITFDGGEVRFDISAQANPNNMTPATQSVALRVRLGPDALIRARFGQQEVAVPAARLLSGALSGNLGAIDSPAWRFHPLPLPRQWQWQGRQPVGPLQDGENLYLRLRQSNGQWTWTSPVFVRA